MYQAITTKFFGPGNVRGSRVKATAQAGSITLAWDHALNPDQNHVAAAQALATKLDWSGKWHGGAHASNGYCFVLELPQGNPWIGRDGFIVRGAK